MTNGRRPIGIDLFCGAGGMSLGFEQAVFDVVAAFDFEPINVEIHTKNHPNCRTLREDITKLSGKKIRALSGLGNRRIDVLFGGPPCQGFSYSNLRTRSSENLNNWLYIEFMRVVRLWEPDWVVFENVKGLTNTEGGIFLEQVLDLATAASRGLLAALQEGA